MFDCCGNGHTFPNILDGIYAGGTFMQTFVLAPQNPKKYYVHKDIFRYEDEVFMKAAGDTSTGTHKDYIKEGQKSFRKAVKVFLQKNYTENFVQSNLWARECLVWSELKLGSVRKVTNFEKIHTKNSEKLDYLDDYVERKKKPLKTTRTPGKLRFDLNASLAKGLSYQPHKERVKPVERKKKSAPVLAAAFQEETKARQMEEIKVVRLNKRAELMMMKRKMSS